MVAKDLWVWQSSVVSDSSQTNALLTFATAQNVTTIYLESEKLINSDQASLSTFIAKAKLHCLDVALLFGAPEWALEDNHSYAVSLAQKSVAFAGHTKTAPVGIQFDVEPYTLDEYLDDTNSVANQFLDMLEKIKAVTSPSKLYFAATMSLGSQYQTIERGGQTMSLSHATIEQAVRIVLMDYRDSASRIIDDASDELKYAAKVGTKMVIGVETSCSTGEVETITFCEEGTSRLNSELLSVQNTYKSNGAFAGLAVHDYTAYKSLN